MNGTAIAGVIARHHIVGVDNDIEAVCKCGWSDLIQLYGYHLLELLIDIADALEEDAAEVAALDTGTWNLRQPPHPGSDAAPAPGQPGSELAPLPPESVAVPSPVDEAPSPVGRGPEEPAAGSTRGSYTKPYTSKDIAAFYSTHTKVDTAAEYGISVATVSRRVAEWERESGTKSRPDVPPHTPLRAKEAIEQRRDREQERVRQAATEIKAREADLVSKNVAEMDDFMARRKANAAAQANAAMEARRNQPA